MPFAFWFEADQLCILAVYLKKYTLAGMPLFSSRLIFGTGHDSTRDTITDQAVYPTPYVPAGSRMDKLVPKKKKSRLPSGGGGDDQLPAQLMSSRQWAGQADPGVISDDEEDDLAVSVSQLLN